MFLNVHNTHQKSNSQTLFLYSEKQKTDKQKQVRNFAEFMKFA